MHFQFLCSFHWKSEKNIYYRQGKVLINDFFIKNNWKYNKVQKRQFKWRIVIYSITILSLEKLQSRSKMALIKETRVFIPMLVLLVVWFTIKLLTLKLFISSFIYWTLLWKIASILNSRVNFNFCRCIIDVKDTKCLPETG